MQDASTERCFEHAPWRKTRGERMVHGVLWGGMIVAAGVLFLLEYLGYLGGYHAWSFWPLILVIAGVDNILRRYRRLFGVALAVTGGLLLVYSLALAPLQWGLVWPVLVIGLGVFLIIKVLTRRRRHPFPPFARGLPPGPVVMGSKEDRIDSQEYAGGEVRTVMGSYVLDLTRAEMQGESAVLHARVVMGAIEIRVPDHWRVDVKSSPILGAIENKIQEPAQAEKTLIIHADVVMGGIEIRN